jgi:16S rRNA (adenine1518-N6/adenine1519-N6)-dimethyltransferase
VLIYTLRKALVTSHQCHPAAVVAIRPDPARRAKIGDVAWFHKFVRRVFLHRRKYRRHVLAGPWRDQWTKADVDAWLAPQGLSGQVRAQSLDVEEFFSRAQALRERWPLSGDKEMARP